MMKLGFSLGLGGVFGLRAAVLQFLTSGFPSALVEGSGSPMVPDYLGVLRKANSPSPAIQGARLATTVAEGALLGPELVVNGGFVSDTVWSKGAGWAISGGVASFDGATGVNMTQASILTIGKRYLYTITVVTVDAGGVRLNPGVAPTTTRTTPGTYAEEIVSLSANFVLQSFGTSKFTIDNISVREVIPQWLDTLADGTPLQPSRMVRTKNGTVKEYIDYPERVNSTVYAAGAKITALASDGARRWYEALNEGTTAAAQPSMPLSGTVVDGGVTWAYGGYSTMNFRRYLGEPSVTPYGLHNRDLTQAAWVKTNATAAKDQTGVGATANAASSLTATADAATCLQAITLASGARTFAPFVKRITGTGTVEITLNGGTSWTDITASLSTSAWYRGSVTATLADPQIGFRLGTSGDKIAVDYAELQASAFATSPIETTTTAVARPATIQRHASAGRLREQGWGARIGINPTATGQASVAIFGSRVDASNYIEVYLTPTMLRWYKVVAGTPCGPQVNYTHTKDQPAECDIIQTAAGMEVRFRVLNGAAFSAWSPWVLDDSDTAKLAMPVGTTYEIGSSNGLAQFAGNIYEVSAPVWSDNVKAKLEALV